jgi:hypothetical protein
MSKCTGWTEEMMKQLKTAGGVLRVHLIASQHELIADFSGCTDNITFMGTLAAPPGSELTKIMVGVKVEPTVNTEYISLAKLETDAIGTVSVDEFPNYVGRHVAALIVCLRGDNRLKEAIAALIHNAQVFGNANVPLFLWYKFAGIKEQSEFELCDGCLPRHLFWVEKAELKQINDLSGPVEDVIHFEWPLS